MKSHAPGAHRAAAEQCDRACKYAYYVSVTIVHLSMHIM
jgi:hypothetical protein